MISNLVIHDRQNANYACLHCLRRAELTTPAGVALPSPVAWDGISGLRRMAICDHERLRQGGGQSPN
jgi:hypothetical protein